VLAASFLTAAAPGAALASSGWSVQSTPDPASTTSTVLAGVSCTSPASCTAVGNSVNGAGVQVALAERWNGNGWMITLNPSDAPPDSSLSGVSCTPRGCMAVGQSNGMTLSEWWNGTAWKLLPTPNPTGGGALSGVSCTSSSACTSVGGSGAVMRWDGSTWKLQPLNQPALQGVSCPSAANCTAVGYTWTSFCNRFRCWITKGDLAARWNGTVWSVGRTGGSYGFLNGVSCTLATRCTAVGQYDTYALAEGWNGSSWTTEAPPSPPGTISSLAGVSCTSGTACIAVGSAISAANYPQTSALAEGLNGPTWTIEATPSPAGATSSVLSAVSCTAANACAAVGYYITASGTDLPLAEGYSG
jgi:hypothetical protein